MDLLRICSVGSVDDGKSTLIGRLLIDSNKILADQMESIKLFSEKRGDDYTDLALLTDGLKAEREQGITIDVAYRYFSTNKRKFILVDCPGHIQYTRNMVTGASNTNLAMVLIDARNGLQEQTRRHCLLASLLDIPHLVVCVNKMDLVGFSEETFEKIRQEFEEFSVRLRIKDIEFIPLSALKGDNVVKKSDSMPWYSGRSLLEHLESVHVASDKNLIDFRYPVQRVIRPQSEKHPDYRAYAGRVSSGAVSVGERVVVLPSGFKSEVVEIAIGEKRLKEASAGMSVSLRLKDDIDVSRGDMIVRENNKPDSLQDLEVLICWLNHEKMLPTKKFIVQHTTRRVKAMVKEILYKIDVNTLKRSEGVGPFELNEIGRARMRLSGPILADLYKNNRETGSLILIDPDTNVTVAAAIII